jgi:hypothetical protein
MLISPPAAFGTLFLALLAIALGLSGCASPLPTHQGLDDQQALQVITRRLESVRTLSASADLILTTPQRQTVSLDSALVAAFPDRARLRAWKMGTAVFDLTILPDATWLYTAEDAPGPGDIDTIARSDIGQALALLGPAYFQTAAIAPHAATSTRLLVTVGPALGAAQVFCEIDRPTLTPLRFWTSTERGISELLLQDYTLIQGVPWPQRIRFRGPEGQVLLRLNDVELNGDLAPGAWTPPPRARVLR